MDFSNLNSNLDEYYAKLKKHQSARDFKKILETLDFYLNKIPNIEIVLKSKTLLQPK